jgi:hypothetical protein
MTFQSYYFDNYVIYIILIRALMAVNIANLPVKSPYAGFEYRQSSCNRRGNPRE